MTTSNSNSNQLPTVGLLSQSTMLIPTAPVDSLVSIQPKQNVLTVSYVVKIAYITIGVLGIVTNLVVIYVIVKNKKMRQHAPDLFLLNQSVADFWTAAFIIGFALSVDVHVQFYGTQGDFVCRVWTTGMTVWIGLLASEYNLVALSIDVYFEIVYPVRHKLLFNRRTAGCCIAAVWMWSLVWNTIIFVPQSGLESNICLSFYNFTSYVAKPALGLFNLVLKVIIPLSVFLFCYLSMARSLKRKTRKVVPIPLPTSAPVISADTTSPAAGAGDGPVAAASVAAATTTATKTKVGHSYARARRNIFKTLIIMISIHVISWSMSQVIFLAFTFGYPINFLSLFTTIAVAIIYVSTCTHPIVYALKYERFRRAFRQTFLGKEVKISVTQPSTVIG